MVDVRSAMVLAAGLGTRIRALDPETPKPLIRVGGRPLIDYTFDVLREAGVERAVVNVHHRADQIEAHLKTVGDLSIEVSDERAELLETGGGIVKALPLLGNGPFFSANTDAILRGGSLPAGRRLIERWNDDCDALLLLVPVEAASGYQGQGDFSLGPDGSIRDRSEGEPLIFTGLQLLRPSLFEGAPVEPVSTRKFWDKARENGRFYGVAFDGEWMHVGDPQGHREAEARLAGGGDRD